MESLANETAESLSDVNTEMVAMRVVTMQNCIDLDLLIAVQGGTCAVVGSECCTCITNKSQQITSLAAKIKEEGGKFHDYHTSSGIMAWLKGVFKSWVAKILQWNFV